MLYDPQEDSFLMAEAILNLKPKGKVLDLGTGTGILAEAASKSSSLITAADKDMRAVMYVKHKFPAFNVVESSYFSGISGKFDLIINNPPYLPNDDRIKDLALDGGKEGWEFIDNMLSQAKKYLEVNGAFL